MSAVTPNASTFARVGRGALAARRGARALRSPRRVAVRASSSAENANDTPGEEEDDDLPPPIKLTADQARIAALAFEVLYEKDPVEEMEEMLVDRERPGLRLKLQQAIKAANEACKDGATVECAAAWEEVDGLEDAAMRAGMTQNAPEGFEPPPAAAAAAAAAPEPRASEDARMSNPATRTGVDPLANMMPCAGESCDVPTGDFEKRGALERAMEMAGNTAEASSDELADAIREAVDVAITMCENGEDASQCAVAWEVVEELSSSANKRRSDVEKE